MIDFIGMPHIRISHPNAMKPNLWDSFSVDYAAGAVNGTFADPSGGKRTVVDTNGKLSIASGVLTFATGGVNYGNPGLWYQAQNRVAGKGLLVTVNFGTISGGGVAIGWDANQTATLQTGIGFWTVIPSTLAVIENNTPLSLGSIVTSQDYSLYVGLRSAGAYLFIKGGAFTYWTLLHIANIQNSSVLYPAILGRISEVFTADNIRIPVSTWLPTPLCYDTFTRADGAIGNSETEGPDGQTTPSLAWSDIAGTTVISTNKLVSSATDGAKAMAGVTGLADVLATMTITRGTGTPGIYFRYTDALNYGYAVHNGTNAQLHKVVNGVDTTLVNAAATYSAAKEIRVICYGTKWRLYYNNAMIGVESVVNDAALQGGVGCGWYTTDTDSSGDNFSLFARGTGNEYSALDRY